MKQLTNTPTRPPYREHAVARGPHRLRVREYEGEGSALVLMHGFPDNLHLHDRLVGHLGGRHVVVFDFLGWGGSDKPERYPYTFDSLTRNLAAVVHGYERNVVTDRISRHPRTVLSNVEAACESRRRIRRIWIEKC